MADTWDMSFLVDHATQIQEARGNLTRDFGMLQQVLIGKHLVNFIVEGEQLAFMRMMGRLSQRNWTELVSVTLRTPMNGARKLALQARPGSGPLAWWLMLSESGAATAKSIADVAEGEDAFATEDEFTAIASAAAESAGRSLDLSVFSAQALTVSPSGAGMSAAKHAELDQKIGETLLDQAAGGVVSRPEPGHYALMHDRDIPAADIADKITETAAEVGVSADKLGLRHSTVPMLPDTDADSMRDLMRNMRQNLNVRTEYARERKGGFMEKMKSLVGIG